MPRSGMVPPLVTARRRAPSRARHLFGEAVPHDARPKFAEVVGGVAPGEEIEHRRQHVVGELGEPRGSPHERGQFGNVVVVHGHRRDDLLGQDVERVPQVARRFDEAFAHSLYDHGRFDQIAPMLGEHGAPTRLADLVSGATDALQTAADGTRRLDLDDQIDGTHVDTELEARGGHQCAQDTPLELIFDDDALLACQRTVVRLDEVAAIGGDDSFRLGQLVEARRHALGQPAGVAEDDGGAVRHHQLENSGVDARPDALAHRAGERGVGRAAAQFGRLRDLTEIAHVLDRNDDVDRQRFAHPGVDDGDRTRLVRRREPAEETGHFFERALGGRQADALRRACTQRVEPFE